MTLAHKGYLSSQMSSVSSSGAPLVTFPSQQFVDLTTEFADKLEFLQERASRFGIHSLTITPESEGAFPQKAEQIVRIVETCNEIAEFSE
jgi:hypothetical protein